MKNAIKYDEYEKMENNLTNENISFENSEKEIFQ